MSRSPLRSENNGQAGPGPASSPHRRGRQPRVDPPRHLDEQRFPDPAIVDPRLGEQAPPDLMSHDRLRLPSKPSPSPARSSRHRSDGLPLEADPTAANSGHAQSSHRGSFESSTSTLNNDREDGSRAFANAYALRKKEEDRSIDQKYALSNHQHPHNIPPPQPAYDANAGLPRKRVNFSSDTKYRDDENFDTEAQAQTGRDEENGLGDVDPGGVPNYNEINDRDGRRKGILTNLMELYGVTPGTGGLPHSRSHAYAALGKSTGRPHNGRKDSDASHSDADSDFLDPDDPRITGITKGLLDDYEDEKRNALRLMDYHQRRKELQKIRIEFNVTSIINRHSFLVTLATALMTFGAPSHRIESQLVAAARILEVNAEFIHLPSVIICSFGDSDTMTSDTHFIKVNGGLSLGQLHEVHLIYRAVLHDEVSASNATEQIRLLLKRPAIYSKWFRCVLGFFASVLICPLAFGGSFLDMWVAGAGAFVLCYLQLNIAAKSAMYANVFEITTAMLMSFVARGLSSIRSQIFCYEAISSAGIIGILPGYLILTSSLELASKNIVCGSVKMVYALIYTLFLGFGLQIGSDLYLLFDPTARHHLATLAARMSTTVTLIGTFSPDNSTMGAPPAIGTFSFTNATNIYTADIVEGCYRPSSFGWYLRPFPGWTQFFIVPIFSTLTSLSNLQPWKSKELIVMVLISCASYTTNKVANHYIFNRSDIVSAIGAFTVGLLGNIYSRKMGGTAFTSMVTGVLFLVPSGLSQAGGITANGSGVDVGSAMIAVTIGITVGLFMSQAIVYMFGTRKNAAVFSF